MNDDERGNGDIERYRSGPPSPGGTESAEPAQSGSALVEAVSGSLSGRNSVTVESAAARATLVGVPTVDVDEFVYSHQGEPGAHPVALFDVENVGDAPLRWHTSRTQFVGTDEYTYQSAQLSLDPATLGPGCHTRQVEVPPGRRARVVTVVETLPPGVEIAEVVHSVPSQSGLGGRERLVFSLG